MVVEIIKNNIFNYNRVGGVVKVLKVILVVGIFILFYVEVIRIVFNIVNLVVEEMKNFEIVEIGK